MSWPTATCDVHCKPANTSSGSGSEGSGETGGSTGGNTSGPVDANTPGTSTNAGNGLNVRSGPGTDYAVIGGLSNGTWVVVLSQQNGWYQVLYRNSSDQAAIGYVSADYLTLTQR